MKGSLLMQATFKRKKKIDHVRNERTDDIPAIHRFADAYDSDSIHCAGLLGGHQEGEEAGGADS